MNAEENEPSERECSVFHESGHAVAAFSEGLPFTEATIEADPAADTSGGVHYDVQVGGTLQRVSSGSPHAVSEEERRVVESINLSDLAGPIAEEEFTGRQNTHGASRDKRHADKFCRRVSLLARPRALFDTFHTQMNKLLRATSIQGHCFRRPLSGIWQAIESGTGKRQNQRFWFEIGVLAWPGGAWANSGGGGIRKTLRLQDQAGSSSPIDDSLPGCQVSTQIYPRAHVGTVLGRDALWNERPERVTLDRWSSQMWQRRKLDAFYLTPPPGRPAQRRLRQFVLRQRLQDPDEDFLMRFKIDQPTIAADRRMVGRPPPSDGAVAPASR